jgi:phosphoglycerate dehydrogenase-like enzyme
MAEPPEPHGALPRTASMPDDRWLNLCDDDPLPITMWDMTGPPPGPVSLVVTPYMRPARLELLAEVPGLAVVQTLTAGYDNVLPYLPDGITLCSAAGVHDASTAELTVGLILAAQRGIGDAARDGLTGAWNSLARPSLADRRVLLVGTGSVGMAVVRRLEAFEVTISRVGTRARDDEHGHVHASEELASLLPGHDVVVLVCPLTPQTRGLVDAAFLAAMPDGALLVNVARGPVVDTDALVAEVVPGRLRAALDVTDPEPLPPDSPLWRAPDVLITPHVGGNTTAFVPRARALLRDQLGRFAAGQPLRNVVSGPAC